MLPPLGTPERNALHDQAVAIAIEALLSEHGNIPNALYTVYTGFRLRFLDERSLMDRVPGSDPDSRAALEDARILEAHVCQQWASQILANVAGSAADCLQT